MAHPRVFVSSTFYDLRQIRTDLEHFMKELGFDPVLHERGGVPYGKDEELERYCYREIQNVDILVSIVGNRFGSTSADGHYSISQMELKTALKLGKQVYIFVERQVMHEHRTYQKNPDTKINWASVDDTKVFKFLDEVQALPNNNQIQSFESAQDITNILREQWSGLFQRFLHEQEAKQQSAALDRMETVIKDLSEAVRELKDKANTDASTINALVQLSHPLFTRLAKIVPVGFPVYARNITELDAFMSLVGYSRNANFALPASSDGKPAPEYFWWSDDSGNKIGIVKHLASNHAKRISIYHERDWNDDYLKYMPHEPPEYGEPGVGYNSYSSSDDGSIPF